MFWAQPARLRARPAPDAQILRRIRPDERILILEELGDWLMVAEAGGVAYVLADGCRDA